MTGEEKAVAQATAVVDEAEAVLQRQQKVAAQTQANAAALQRLAQMHGIGVTEQSVLAVRLNMLVEHLLGDEGAPARLDYEEACAGRFAQLIAGLGEQAARAKLTQGIIMPGSGRG